MSVCAYPAKDELIFFGGETPSTEQDEVRDRKKKDVSKDLFLRDVLRYNLKKNTWTEVMSQNSPLPRSSHQAAIVTMQGADYMYIFGGEFADSLGDNFRHFNDLWRLNLLTNQWEQIQWKGSGPSPRSGHRMVA